MFTLIELNRIPSAQRPSLQPISNPFCSVIRSTGHQIQARAPLVDLVRLLFCGLYDYRSQSLHTACQCLGVSLPEGGQFHSAERKAGHGYALVVYRYERSRLNVGAFPTPMVKKPT